jgi:hypothetical protein
VNRRKLGKMRLQLGEVTRKEEFFQPTEDWHTIQSPILKVGYWLAAAIGLTFVCGLWVMLGMWSSVVGERGGIANAGDSANPWIVTIIVLVLFIPLHELVHLISQPQWGASSRSVVVFWPARLRFGVYYEGCMSRRRWLGMRMAPFAILTLLPVCVLALLQFVPQIVDLEIGLFILMVVNTLGSGGDVIAALAVMTQVPRSAQLCFQDGRAYWRSA